jgi:hypothetical protein
MSQGPETKVSDSRRLLVERLATSSYFNRSTRLRDLLVYLTDRVLEEDAAVIHEQEVGHKLFGRAADYDTAADNIVRVHASMLRKRLEQYFATEGADEEVVLEIPKGNYAPAFRPRSKPAPEPLGLETLPVQPAPHSRPDVRLLAALACAVLFASSTALLLWRRSAGGPVAPASPTVRLFWSQVLRPGRVTDVVMDDGAVGIYQELTGHPLSLTEYYDRSYLRTIPSVASAAGLDPQLAAAMVLRRQTSFADTSFSWRLLQFAAASGMRPNLRFARDYTFRDLKADNAVLLGNARTNPWLQPFEEKLGIRWMFDKAEGVYYPVDTSQSNHSYRTNQPGEAHEAYFSVALLPNLGGTGNVLLISGTGGSATNAAADFLAGDRSLTALRHNLPATKDGSFPPFEALVNAKGRGGTPRDFSIVLCRPAAK